MATTNARIQFSTDSIDTWTTINPTLREGEPVLAKTNDGKYALYAGNIGGSLFTESVLIWDETKAEGIIASAQAAADEAETYCNTCKQSATEAATSATEAATSATNAAASATEAAKQATAAEASAANASVSEKSAAYSAEQAQKYSERSDAAAQADKAAAYAAQAAESKNAAAASAVEAAASAVEAAASATEASTLATNAANSASEAATSASDAKADADEADASKTAAAASEANTKIYAANAATSESNAKVSEKAAGKSEANAATSATNAATSETNAAASATAAATSSTNAGESETAAKTAEANAAASAKKAEEEAAKLTGALKYKGSVATYADLPTNAETGDVWNIQKADKTHGIKAGDNVAWSGTDWDSLGGTCDLSEYALTADQQKDVVNASVNGATVTLIARDGTNTPLTVNDVAHATAADTATKATTADSATTAASATKASQDGQGNTISTTYAKAASLATVATSGSYNDLADKPDAYTLPTASSSTLGGVKIGGDLSIATDGVLSVSHATAADTATNDSDGNAINTTYLKAANVGEISSDDITAICDVLES